MMAVSTYWRQFGPHEHQAFYVADTAAELPTTGVANGSMGYVVATDSHYGRHAGGWVLFSAGSAGLVSVLRRDSSSLTIANLTETAIFSYTIPASTLGASDELRLTLKNEFLNNSGASRGFTIRVKLGGTTIINLTTGTTAYPTGASLRLIDLKLLLSALGATDSQVCTLGVLITAPSSTFGTLTTGVGTPLSTAVNYGEVNSGTLSQDMTTSKVLEVSIELSATNASLTWRNYSGTLEKLGT